MPEKGFSQKKIGLILSKTDQLLHRYGVIRNLKVKQAYRKADQS